MTKRAGGGEIEHVSKVRSWNKNDAPSKKVENHEAATDLHFMHYNFCRVHQTLRVTPAMEAGIASHVWAIAQLIGLLDAVGKKAA